MHLSPLETVGCGAAAGGTVCACLAVLASGAGGQAFRFGTCFCAAAVVSLLTCVLLLDTTPAPTDCPPMPPPPPTGQLRRTARAAAQQPEAEAPPVLHASGGAASRAALARQPTPSDLERDAPPAPSAAPPRRPVSPSLFSDAYFPPANSHPDHSLEQRQRYRSALAQDAGLGISKKDKFLVRVDDRSP